MIQQRAWIRAMGAIGLTVSLCVCGGEAPVRKDEPTPVQKQLDAVLRLDAEASALALRVDQEARNLNAGRLRVSNLGKLTPADLYPRRAFAISAFKASDELMALEGRLDKAIAAAYGIARKGDLRSSSAADLQTALLHYTVLLRRQSGTSWHTVVPGLADDPACAGDIIGEQLLAHYFSSLFSRAKDNRERAAFYLTEIARHTSCLGTEQAAQIARELAGASNELEAFLRSIDRGDLIPYVANVLAQPLLLFYDIDIYRARESDLYPWFSTHHAALAEGAKVKRTPAAWGLLWLYDRRTGRLIGFKESDLPKNPQEVNLPAFFGSITRLENVGGGACSFSEMIQRGGDATSGYFCAGQACAAKSGANQANPSTLPARTITEFLKTTRDGNFSADLACALQRDARPGSGTAACPEAGGPGAGGGPDAALLGCVSRQVARPGLEEMSCLAEAIGFCSSPVDRVAKDLQMTQYSGVRIGRDCGISQQEIHLETPKGDPKARKEARENLQKIREALKGVQDPVKQFEDAGVWEKAFENAINDTKTEIEQTQDAIDRNSELLAEALRLQQESKDRGDTREADRLDKVAEERREADIRLRDKLNDLKEKLERLEKNQRENAKHAGSHEDDKDGGKDHGTKRCVEGAESCGGNDCTAMASAVKQALKCVIARRQQAEAGEIHDPRGCTPENCDPMEPEGEGGRGGQCLAELGSNPTTMGVRTCWAVRCPLGQIPTVGPGGDCTCNAGEFVGVTPSNPVAEMCQYMRCTGGDNAMVASMQSGGSCGCAPEGGSGEDGVINEERIATMLPPVRDLLDLNPNVQTAVMPLVPGDEGQPFGQPGQPPPP